MGGGGRSVDRIRERCRRFSAICNGTRGWLCEYYSKGLWWRTTKATKALEMVHHFSCCMRQRRSRINSSAP